MHSLETMGIVLIMSAAVPQIPKLLFILVTENFEVTSERKHSTDGNQDMHLPLIPNSIFRFIYDRNAVFK